MAIQIRDLQKIHHNCFTLVDVLYQRSLTQPDTIAFTFLEDGETQQSTLTYKCLHQRSCAIASQLQALNLTGERALLLYPPGLDYLTAFFGCLYAGVVAVPAYPPSNQRKTPRIQAISTDAQPCIALTTTAMLPKLQSIFAQQTNLESLHWLTTDDLTPDLAAVWQKPQINLDTLAFLQYTSGSTGTPKGVMLSHGNLLHNAAMTYQIMEHSPSSKFVSWLPVYHDMGLISGILQPLYGGFPCILMSPTSFLQRPFRWLQAISDYKGTTSGSPNFAYELCIQKITAEQKQILDLSSWSVAFNGAEPIRQDTLERFTEAFAECGFRPEAFYPCYGMAEATLMISGGIKKALPVCKTIVKSALSKNQIVAAKTDSEDIQTFVGCGQTLPQQQIAIAHPETLTRCQPDEVGEIWVSGPSVGQGYWQQPDQTEQIFHAYLQDTKEGPFLRTGDLGFLHNGELFITGRAKDLIIIRGRNLYPQDIELSAERSHPSLRLGSNAAFAVEIDHEEQLVIVQELEFRAKPNLEEVTAAIRQAVAQAHEVQVYAVVLIKPGSIPKTSSGKIQRRATKADFLAGNLDILGSSIQKSSLITENHNRLQRESLLALTPRECQLLLESYIQELLAQMLSLASHEINLQQPLSSLGLDSLKVFELKNRIEVDLEVTVSVADIFESLNIPALATTIVAELATATSTKPVSITQAQTTTETHPLSFAQQRLWFIHQLAADTPVYNIPIVINLTGSVNIAVLEQSLNEIIKRHHILRTNFALSEGKPIQIIKSAVPLSLSVEDLQELSPSDRTEQVQRLSSELAQQPFDLSSQPLLRAKLLRLAKKEYRLLLTLHHIIADGWSMGILIKELAALYEAFSLGKPSSLSELPIQYVDFAYWQQQWLQTEQAQKHLEYWKQQLNGNLPVLNLPIDQVRSPIQTFKGAQTKLVLSPTLTAALKQLSHQEGVTLFMTLLAAFKTLLYRYTGQTDIIVGSPIANRNRAEIEALIGFFVNVLVLRTNLDGQLNFRELLSRVKSTTLDAYVHQDLPFEKLVQELQPQRDLSYNPLFQVMFVFQNIPLPTPKLSEISITGQEGYSGTAKFDLTLFMEDSEQGLVATAEYNTDLFHADTITRMLGHFETLLAGIVADPQQHLWDLPLISPVERQTMLVEWNQTQVDYPRDLCIHQLFEQQVERTPNAVAVIFENQQLTYRELNNRANQLAQYLQKLGVKPEVLVGIFLERSSKTLPKASLDMVVAVLAILKAGGAYLPLDPTHPQERLAFILKDTYNPVLLTQQRLVKKLPTDVTKVVCLDTDWQKIAQEISTNPISKTNSANLAYVIYTSGSTGKPKGTLIQHRGLVNYLNWCTQKYKVEEGTGTLVHSPLGFDLTITSLFSPLLVGRQVKLLPEHQDIDTLYTALGQSSHLSLVKLTPAHLELLGQQFSPEKAAGRTQAFIIGGENLLAQHIAFWQKYAPDTILINEYGPTETVVGCCIYQVPIQNHSGSIPIGRPIANTQLYVLDQHLQPTPIGVAGELHIGGSGLARGYLNQPQLTAQKFIPNPFSDEPGERLYKTGDLARYRCDGTLEFLGRIDNQVKIRGFRIEIGEIEAAILEHPGVQESVVVVQEERLVAYIVWHTNLSTSINELSQFIKQKLPQYMLPAAFVPLDVLPLTSNGKVDRKLLPIVKGFQRSLEIALVQPSNEVEQTIADVWREVLHLEQVGIYDNFFDIGGHSLLVAQVHSQLQKLLKPDLSMIELLEYPTIHSLAKYLSQEKEVELEVKLVRDRAQKQKQALKKVGGKGVSKK